MSNRCMPGRLRNLAVGPQAETGYPACVKTHRPVSLSRALSRAAALGAFAVVLLGSGTASADAPSTWQDSPHVSGLQALTVYFLIPFGLFLLISLLAALPSMIRGSSYKAGQPWLGEPEWFGGPRGGVEAPADEERGAIESARNQGGAGAR